MPLSLVAVTATILLATSQRAQAAGHVLADDAGEAVFLGLFVMGGFTLAWRCAPVRALRRAQAKRTLRFIFGVPLAWLLIAVVHDETGVSIPNWVGYSLWLVLVVIILIWGEQFVPARLRRLFVLRTPDTHGSAHFGSAAIAAPHLAPAAPADAFALGRMRDVSRRKDARFRYDGHILTCAPTGAGKGRRRGHPQPAGLSRFGFRARLQRRELCRDRPRPP
jgi:hypothetical protein